MIKASTSREEALKKSWETRRAKYGESGSRRRAKEDDRPKGRRRRARREEGGQRRVRSVAEDVARGRGRRTVAELGTVRRLEGKARLHIHNLKERTGVMREFRSVQQKKRNISFSSILNRNTSKGLANSRKSMRKSILAMSQVINFGALLRNVLSARHANLMRFASPNWNTGVGEVDYMQKQRSVKSSKYQMHRRYTRGEMKRGSQSRGGSYSRLRNNA